MCLKKTHSARLKHISLLESRASYNDYDHGAMPLSFADFRSRPCNRICSESILQGIKDKARKRAPPFA